MRRGVILGGIVVCLAITIHLQSLSQPVGAKNAAAGGITSLGEDLWAAACNPAGLAGLKKRGVGLGYEQRFLLRELSCFGIVTAWPVGRGGLGLHMGQAGSRYFRELDLGMSYGMAFGKWLCAGVSLEYIGNMAAEGLEKIHTLTFRIGLITAPGQKFRVSFEAFNPMRIVYSTDPNGKCPTIFRAGVSYRPAEALQLLTEVEKEAGYKVIWRTGIIMSFRERFMAGIGYVSSPTALTFGFGLTLRGLEINFASVLHQYLGYYPLLSVQYEF